MALAHVNGLADCPFKVEIFIDGQSLSETCDVHSIQAILDPREAAKYHLDVSFYKSEVTNLFRGENDRITAIAFEKDTRNPCGIAIFKKRSYDPSHIRALPSLELDDDILNVSRKSMWELKYCIRRVDQKGKCIGDLCLATGLEAVLGQHQSERRPSTAYVWLILAGGLGNRAALTLYLSYGFEVVGMHLDAVLLVLKDLHNASIGRAIRLVSQRTEALYLLPVLKERHLPLASRDSQVSGPGSPEVEDPFSQSTTATPAGEELSQELPDDDDDDSDSSSEDTDQEHHRRGTPNRRTATDSDTLPVSVRQATGCRSRAQFETYVSNLEFYSFVESSLCESARSIKPSIKNASEATMIENVTSMINHLGDMETYQVFLQNLEIAQQIDLLGRTRDTNSLSVAWELSNGPNRIRYSYSYLKEIMELSWAVYRFPVLKQVRGLSFRNALRVLPEIAAHFDRKLDNNDVLPRNVKIAQDSRYDSAYLRLSLQFPTTTPGDGDGLSELEITKVHGFFISDQSCRDERIKDAIIGQYPNELRTIHDTPTQPIRKRSRILGYDTQESPRAREDQVLQRYWREGRDFLVTQLRELRGVIPVANANLLVDCYGVDFYERLLIDIRSVYDVQDPTSNLQPSLRRFEIAERALSSGYAFPTPHYFHNAMLAESFASAARDRRGAFGEEEEFVSPRVCRLARFEFEKKTRRERRRVYTE